MKIRFDIITKEPNPNSFIGNIVDNDVIYLFHIRGTNTKLDSREVHSLLFNEKEDSTHYAASKVLSYFKASKALKWLNTFEPKNTWTHIE